MHLDHMSCNLFIFIISQNKFHNTGATVLGIQLETSALMGNFYPVLIDCYIHQYFNTMIDVLNSVSISLSRLSSLANISIGLVDFCSEDSSSIFHIIGILAMRSGHVGFLC